MEIPQRGNTPLLYATVVALSLLAGCTKSPALAFYASCKEKILEQLRAPATARFPELKTIWVAKKGSAAFAQGEVDAQNSYGALIRTRFLCGRDVGRFKGVHVVVIKDAKLSRDEEKWRDLLPETELLYEGLKEVTEETRRTPELATLLPGYEAQLEEARSTYEFAKVMAGVEKRRYSNQNR